MSEALLVSYAALWALVLAIAVGLLALYRHFGEMYLTSREGRVTEDRDRGGTPVRPCRAGGWHERATPTFWDGKSHAIRSSRLPIVQTCASGRDGVRFKDPSGRRDLRGTG